MQGQTHQQTQFLFNASEVAEFEYCPLVWWYEQFDPIMEVDNEALFAAMVDIENEYGEEAPSLPDYQVIERLLVHRGATLTVQPRATGDEWNDYNAQTLKQEEIAEENTPRTPLLRWGVISGLLLIVALSLIATALFLHIQPVLLSNIALVVGLGLALFALAMLLLIINERHSQRQRFIEERHQDLGLPPGKLVYENVDDTGEAIISDQSPLAGKPDYIVELADGRMVPVEQNLTVHDETKVYPNHEVLVAAYCLILEDYSQAEPTHGIMRYADREFIVEYTPTLRKRVLRRLKEMQQCDETQAPQIKTQKAAKCRACVFQPVCEIGRDK